MTSEEAANFGIRINENREYEVFIRDDSAIAEASASAAYGYLSGLVNDDSISAGVGVLGQGFTVDSRALGIEVRSMSGAFAPPITLLGQGKDVDVLVRMGSRTAVKVLDANGREVDGTVPDYVAMAHELFGETRKYRAGNEALRQATRADDVMVIAIENQIRAFHRLPLRSGSDHWFGVVVKK
jgi:hypothetical protein